MKQVQRMMSRSIKGAVTTASMFVFSVSLANGNAITTASPNTSTPYSYSDPNSTVSSYNNVGRAVDEQTQSLTLNNQTLGLEGPVNISTGYSSNYGVETNASFTHMLGFYDAISLLGAYAPQENRVDITWAHAWTEKQRTKLSVERLEEDMDFDYDSGSVTEWVPQYSYGAGYQYLFNKNWLKNVELSGYYAQAQSQDLSTVRFTGTDGNLYDNYRHIAGATTKGSEATLNVSPWKTGLVGLGLNYDSVKYDTKYDDTDAENANGLGFTLTLEQLLSKHVKFNIQGSQREIYDNYVAGVSFLTPSNLELGLNGERTLGENGSATDSRFNLNLAYFFDDKNRYENGYNLEDPSQNDLAVWASKSVAYMDEVLAAADQKTVQVIEPEQSSNAPMLQTTDTTPVINLKIGEINHIDLSDYVANANLTNDQKETTPIIKGGPSDVEFTYDNATQTLVTKAEVPESAAKQESEPLVLVFPSDAMTDNVPAKNILRDAFTERLTFKVMVSGNTTALNPAFVQDQHVAISHDLQNVTFLYQNSSAPAGPSNANVMFLNSSESATALTFKSISPTTSKCYTWDKSLANQITFQSKGSAACPDTETFEVVVNNGGFNSPAQKINFISAPANAPFVYGAPITSPELLENKVYSPGYPFPTTGNTNVVSPGEGGSFKTTAGANTLLVCNANTNTAITDSNLELGVKASQITLQSTQPLASKYIGIPLNIYLTVTNQADSTNNNGVSCGDSSGHPFTAMIQGAPSIPANIPLGSMAVDTAYTYNFMTDGGSTYNVTPGSSPITSMAGSMITVKNSTGTQVLSGEDLSGSLGLKLAQQGNNVVLSGIINPGYVGDTVYVTLNLTNSYGTGNNSAAPAFSDAITVNLDQTPTVGGGEIASANMTQTYPGAILTGTTPGTGLSYASVNTESDLGTYVKVSDVTGNDVTANAHVTLAANGSVLNLQSDGTAVALASGTYNVYVYATNTAPASASNCATSACTAPTDKPYVMMVNSGAILQSGVELGPQDENVAYNYDFVSKGILTLGTTSLLPGSSSVTFSLSADTANTALEDTGLTYTITGTDVVLGGTPAAKYGNTMLNVIVHLVDEAGFVTEGTETLTITVPSIEASSVGTGAMPGVNQGSAYTSSTLTGTTAGAGRSYVNVNTVSDTGTYVKVADENGNDVTNKMNVNLSENGEVLNLQSNGGVVDSSLSGSYNVYVHVMNDANVVSSNCGVNDPTCSTLTGGTPYTVFVNTPPVIAPNLDMSIGAGGPATINVGYSYDFSAQSALTLGNSASGATNLATSALTMTLADGTTSVNPVELGLTPTYSSQDVILAGTPIAGKAGTYKVFLMVTDALGFTVDNSATPATLTIAAPAPVFAEGDFSAYHPSVGDTFTYTFANSIDTANGKAVVSAGPGEYFDEATTTWTVTGADGSSKKDLFELIYSQSANAANHGNSGAPGTNNVVTLQSKAPLTSSDTFTVTFDVHNVDDQSASGSPGSATVGAVPGYLSCPPSTQIGNDRPNTTMSNLYSQLTGGTVLSTVNFNRQGSDGGSKPVKLYSAQISVSGSQTTLTCKYDTGSDTGFAYTSSTTITTVDGNGVQGVSGWNSTTSPTQCYVTGTPTDTSCQVTFSYSGQSL